MKIEGSLKYILGFLLKSSPKQIQLSSPDNKMYILEVQFQKNLESVSYTAGITTKRLEASFTTTRSSTVL